MNVLKCFLDGRSSDALKGDALNFTVRVYAADSLTAR